MKKLFLLIALLSVFLLTSCELIFGKNDDNNSSGGGSSSEKLLVITNDSFRDKAISGISSVTGRSARTTYQAADFEPVNNGPAIIDVNFDFTDLLKDLQKCNNNENSLNANFISTSINKSVAVNDTANFWCFDRTASMDDSSKVAKYQFVAKAVGTKCIIWVCNGTFVQGASNTDTDRLTEPSIANDKFTALASSLDSVFTKEMSIFGSNVQNLNSSQLITADSNTMLNVLIYDICGDGQNNNNSAIVGGLFYNADLCQQNYLTSNSDSRLKKLKSNECECIHADSYLLKRDIDNNSKFITSTLLHEFQHMLHFINKNVKNNMSSETWFNEMLSMSAEDIFQTQLGLSDADSPKSRMSTFNARYFDGFRNWRSGNDVLNSYANAYAFGAYLMRNYGGVKLIHQIATNNYINEAAITAALQQLGFNEDFYSVLHKFENVIVYPDDDDKPNLKKSVTETFNGVTYNLTSIPLMNYLTVIREDQKSCYYDIDNRYYSRDGNAYIRGPVILNNGYYHNNYLGSAGTYVLYFGGQTPMIIDENGLYQRVLER